MTTTETDLATSLGKRRSKISPSLSQDEKEDNHLQMALNGMIDIASFDHPEAWLPVHSVCPRSHLQLVQVFLDQSAHQKLELLIQLVRWRIKWHWR